MASIFHTLKPTDFKITGHYWNTFGHNETEVSAKWIVRFLRDRMQQGEVPLNGWAPFSLADLTAFYHKLLGSNGVFFFNRLTGDDNHVTVQDGLVSINPSFISRLASQPDMFESESPEVRLETGDEGFRVYYTLGSDRYRSKLFSSELIANHVIEILKGDISKGVAIDPATYLFDWERL